jgi:hypothetical protein
LLQGVVDDLVGDLLLVEGFQYAVGLDLDDKDVELDLDGFLICASNVLDALF